MHAFAAASSTKETCGLPSDLGSNKDDLLPSAVQRTTQKAAGVATVDPERQLQQAAEARAEARKKGGKRKHEDVSNGLAPQASAPAGRAMEEADNALSPAISGAQPPTDSAPAPKGKAKGPTRITTGETIHLIEGEESINIFSEYAAPRRLLQMEGERVPETTTIGDLLEGGCGETLYHLDDKEKE